MELNKLERPVVARNMRIPMDNSGPRVRYFADRTIKRALEKLVETGYAEQVSGGYQRKRS